MTAITATIAMILEEWELSLSELVKLGILVGSVGILIRLEKSKIMYVYILYRI